MDQQLQRYGQLELRETLEAYYIRHIMCGQICVFKYKPVLVNTRQYRDLKLRTTPCKCGLSKKAMQFLLNIIKLLTT